MTKDEIINWLLEGDVAVQYQTFRDLLNDDQPKLRERIAKEGWGAGFLEAQNTNGHWGKGFYQPKWTSSHYTLLDLKNLGIPPENKIIKKAIFRILETEKGKDGGINPSNTLKQSDVCINGMALNYASYFRIKETLLTSVVDFLLAEQMPDGGFNCQSNRKGATHSSLHSSISVAEGFFEYRNNSYCYRQDEIVEAEKQTREFILQHQLFLSDRTGKLINQNFLKLRFPCRWYYDILRAMDYFRQAGISYDRRMDEAVNVILKKRNREGLWHLAAKHPGQLHFEMEKAGKPSRWNTLRAMRVLQHFGFEDG